MIPKFLCHSDFGPVRTYLFTMAKTTSSLSKRFPDLSCIVFSKWQSFLEARSGQNCDNKIVPQVSFFSHCCTFYQLVVYFHRRYNFFFFLRRLLITFSNVNYFSPSLVKFFIGSTNEFSHSHCYLFLTVRRIIFYFWYWELFFHWRWELFVNLFFGLQYIAGLRLRGDWGVFDFLG